MRIKAQLLVQSSMVKFYITGHGQLCAIETSQWLGYRCHQGTQGFLLNQVAVCCLYCTTLSVHIQEYILQQVLAVLSASINTYGHSLAPS